MFVSATMFNNTVREMVKQTQNSFIKQFLAMMLQVHFENKYKNVTRFHCKCFVTNTFISIIVRIVGKRRSQSPNKSFSNQNGIFNDLCTNEIYFMLTFQYASLGKLSVLFRLTKKHVFFDSERTQSVCTKSKGRQKASSDLEGECLLGMFFYNDKFCEMLDTMHWFPIQHLLHCMFF